MMKVEEEKDAERIVCQPPRNLLPVPQPFHCKQQEKDDEEPCGCGPPTKLPTIPMPSDCVCPTDPDLIRKYVRRKPCNRAPHFQPDTEAHRYVIPDCCQPPVITEPCKEPLNPVGAFAKKSGVKVEMDSSRRRELCCQVPPPEVFDWPRKCRDPAPDPKYKTANFEPYNPILPLPMECCQPPLRKARIRQTICERSNKMKFEAPFIPILNTRGQDPHLVRGDYTPKSGEGQYTSPACRKGFFSHVQYPEASPCFVSEEEKNALYMKMVYTTTARKMMDDIPYQPNTRLPLTTTLEDRADMVKYCPKKFAPVSSLWQQVPTVWDRLQNRTKVDNVVGDRDACPKINEIVPDRKTLINNIKVMPPCPVAPKCFVCQAEKPKPKYECSLICPYPRP